MDGCLFGAGGSRYTGVRQRCDLVACGSRVCLLASLLLLIPIVPPTFLLGRIDTSLLFLRIKISSNLFVPLTRTNSANQKSGLYTEFAGLHSSEHAPLGSPDSITSPREYPLGFRIV